MKKKLLSINSGLWSLAQQAETHCIQKIPHTSNNARFWLKISHIFSMLSNKRCKQAELLSCVNTKEEKFTLQLCIVIKSIHS